MSGSAAQALSSVELEHKPHPQSLSPAQLSRSLVWNEISPQEWCAIWISYRLSLSATRCPPSYRFVVPFHCSGNSQESTSDRTKLEWPGAQSCRLQVCTYIRHGTRFQVRGVNDFGRVANFAETEQVTTFNALQRYQFNLIRKRYEVTYEFKIRS